MLLILSMQNSVLLSYLKSKPSKKCLSILLYHLFLIFPLDCTLIILWLEPSNHSSNISPAFSLFITFFVDDYIDICSSFLTSTLRYPFSSKRKRYVRMLCSLYILLSYFSFNSFPNCKTAFLFHNSKYIS